MAQCKWCGRSGWFLSITTNGLCSNCDPILSMDVVQRGRIINDSMKLVQESKKLDTQLSRCDLLLEHAEALVKYEEHEIPTIRPSPSALLHEYRAKRDVLILKGLEREVEDTLAKVEVSSGSKAKINQLSKVLLKIREYKTKTNSAGLLDALEVKVKSLIHQTQLNAYIDEARKAEFKGQSKKALDQYYEALYFLKHDDIDDSLQSEYISTMETKIAELGGDKAV